MSMFLNNIKGIFFIALILLFYSFKDRRVIDKKLLDFNIDSLTNNDSIQIKYQYCCQFCIYFSGILTIQKSDNNFILKDIANAPNSIQHKDTLIILTKKQVEIINNFFMDIETREIWCIYCSFSHTNSIYTILHNKREIEFCHNNWGLLWSEIFNDYLIFKKNDPPTIKEKIYLPCNPD